MTKNLNKYLAVSGICSRRKADELIKSGKIQVNGTIIKEPYCKVKSDDIVLYDGKEVKLQKLQYILLNKSKGYVTTLSDEKGRKTVIDLIETNVRIYPVGRLDKDTTGLLLLTNDGDLAQKLAHPKYEVEKIYQVTLDKKLKGSDIEKIRKGITLDDGYIKVDYIDSRGVVKLHSGRNRIVRRIFEHLGYEIVKLDRVGYAGLTKKDLRLGSWRFLSEKEINNLI